ncbi:radical SAM protein [Thermomonas sp. HDW16]|uniref:radical SAM/SPASM domain-containing protein n=1 Tax=Thermomonas sp. HDW16 TaxID=2714945 RepID=UPI00140CA39C|nr:radical SAM protein [Thermomonas sp. HDW16]QIL20522.1 radical SAM protein [Thermomonas sp. HDW16]
MSLMHRMGARALELGLPLSVQLDLTYRCNERCVHCYLDHEDHGEMDTAEILALLDQMAAAGVFFLTISGGEIFMRPDLFEIVERARALGFSVKLKTNAVMVRAAKARRIAALGVDSVQVSLYSHDAATHDDITKLPGSFKRTIEGVRFLRDAGVKVTLANVLMTQNADDYKQVQALADEMGVGYTVDATITPMMDGDRSIVSLNMDADRLTGVMRDATLLGDQADRVLAPPSGPTPLEEAYKTLPCSAGHTACYVSPYGDVYPCVQFPYKVGNVREQGFIDIWRDSPQLNEVRAIRVSDLQGCSSCVHGSSCSRCPGLAYMEGNMRGPSIQDCEKSYARTGVPSKNLQQKKMRQIPLDIVA